MNASLRKAAILVSSLDPRSADALLDQMGDEQAAKVRMAAVELGDVDPAEQQRVIAEFMGRKPQTPSDGVELDESLTRRFAAGETGQPRAKYEQTADVQEFPSRATIVTPAENAPFRFLHDATGETLTRFLQREHPQTAAVVVSHLPPSRAAEVIRSLDPSLQGEVLRRVADLDEMDADVIREVEKEVETLLADELRTSRRRSAGLNAVQAILQAAGPNGQDLRDKLASRDERLAEQVDRTQGSGYLNSHSFAQARKPATRPAGDLPMEPAAPDPESETPAADPQASEPTVPPRPATKMTFDELSRLDDASLAKVLRASNPQTALLALTGATEELVNRLLGQLPAAEDRALRKKMQQIGPLQLADIEKAQRRLADVAGELVDDGVIELPARRFAVAA